MLEDLAQRLACPVRARHPTDPGSGATQVTQLYYESNRKVQDEWQGILRLMPAEHGREFSLDNKQMSLTIKFRIEKALRVGRASRGWMGWDGEGGEGGS